MTTPAKNINMSSPASYVQTQNGYVVASGNASSSRFSSYRPASIDNPLRDDNTRQPSSWSSSGGYGKGSNSTAGLSFSRPSNWPPYKELSLSKGQVASPPVQMGAFNSPVGLNTLRSFAIRDALGQFAKAEQSLGVALRETKQTVDLVRQYYSAVNKGAGGLLMDLTNARPGNSGKQLLRNMKDWANGWKEMPTRYLEYLYGIRPLADEIDNAVEVLTQTRDRGYGFRMTLKGKYRKSQQSVEFNPLTNGNSGTFLATVRAQIEYEAKASLVFELPDWYWSTLPPVTAFSEQLDTTSLSFVLDWVLPVKNWVRGFEGLQLRPFFSEGSATTFLRRSATSCDFAGIPPWTGSYNLPYQLKEYSMTRVVYDTFPTEAVMALPQFRNLLGIDKMDQIAALAGQRLSALSRFLKR